MKIGKKLIVIMLTVMMIFSGFMSDLMIAKADTGTSTIVYTENIGDIVGVPGKTVHVKLPVRSTRDYIENPIITVDDKDMPYTVSNISFTAEGYTAETPPLGISISSTTYIEFDINVKETAKISRNEVKVNVSYREYNDIEGRYVISKVELPPFILAIETENEPAQLTIDNIEYKRAMIGSDTTLSFVIKNEGQITAHNAYFSIDYGDSKIEPGYSKTKQQIGEGGKLAAGESYKVKLPITITSAATAGSKTISVVMECKNLSGAPQPQASNTIYIDVTENTEAPKIEIESSKYASELKAGDEFSLVTTLFNSGVSAAYDIEVVVESLGIESFLPKYTTKTITGGDLESDDKLDVKIPLIVSKEASVGIKEIPITINYKNSLGVKFTTTTKLYLEIVAAEGVDSSGKPNVLISNVSQNPLQPNAGARVDISFDLENKSKINISEIKIAAVNLSSQSFAPVNSEPYQYIDLLEGGKKARITLPLIVSDFIPEGTNSLTVKYEYKDENGKTWSENTATIYVLDIQNSSVTASKPKLIISDFSTDIEELRAGKTFNFIFDINNTHSNVDAKNIKVTVTQAENIFAVTEGSNTFYIDKISAGQTVQNQMQLKVKSDAVTKAYPLEIKIEYDYVGAEVNPETGEMNEVTVTETINLQAVENSRPVVDNVMIGSWDMPIVNQETYLTFEFYNMGKSPLNNVHATLEGDYYINTGSMYYIGNVQPGYSEFAELMVVPTVEGQAKGTLVITFEDSNGDEVTVTKEFESMVQGAYMPDFPVGDPGMEVPIVEPAKKPILPLWLFIIVQVGIFVVFVPVTRKIRLGLYRRKLRKQEEAK